MKQPAKNRRSEGKKFLNRLDKLGFNQSDAAVLLKRTLRCVHYYVHGERKIPHKIWLALTKLEETDGDKLRQTVLRKRKK